MRIVMAAATAAVLVTAAFSGHAFAASAGQSKMQQCAAQWQDLKKAKQTGGQDYKSFSSNCMKGGAAPAAPAPVIKTSAPAAMPVASGGSKMQQCAAQWNTLKAQNKTGGQDYKTFSSNCLKGGAAPAVTPAPAPVVKASAPVAVPAASGGSKMQQCAAQWNTLKAQNKTGGQDYKTFSSSCLKGATTVALAPTVAAKSKPAAAVVPTGGKMSQQDRMRQCGAQWTQMKAQNKTNGMTYKQWSSQCLKSH